MIDSPFSYESPPSSLSVDVSYEMPPSLFTTRLLFRPAIVLGPLGSALLVKKEKDSSKRNCDKRERMVGVGGVQ